MSYFLFVDESGQDHNASPYEVIAGLAVNTRELWDLIRIMHDFEIECFGVKYGNEKREIKARNFLDTRTVNSGHVDPSFWDVDPPAKQAIKVRA
jgi:hypothetical protein